MAKIVTLLLITLHLLANSSQSCIECHKRYQIPDKIIYKRYLQKYSTQKNMKKAILMYLKNPDQKNSVMPSVFFSKFPMKKAMSEEDLSGNIGEYLKIYDVRKRLVLEE